MRRRYTLEEIDILAAEYRRGTPVAIIALRLGRSVNSVVSAARQRAIRHPNNGKGRTRRRGAARAKADA